MGLKYCYAGYSRCGTKTIASAFKILGYKVYDYEETMLYALDDLLKLKDNQLEKEERRKILHNVLKDVDVVTDCPYYIYWREIMEIFPDCKFIFYGREITYNITNRMLNLCQFLYSVNTHFHNFLP